MSVPLQVLPHGFWGVLTEAKRIITTHPRRHFLSLPIFLLLSLSFSLIVYPTFRRRLLLRSLVITTTTDILLRRHFQPNNINTNLLLFSLIYSFFVFVFSLSAIATITYSVFHGFSGQPVKLLSTIRLILTSFLTLLGNVIVSQVIVCLISLVFGGFLFLVFRGIELMDVRIEYSSPYFIGFSSVFLLAFLFLLVNFQVNWTLLSVILVVEFNWGFTALRRSSVDLMKGMKQIALSSLLFLVIFAGILIWMSSSVSSMDSNNEGKNWGLVFQIVVVFTLLLMLILLHKTASKAVLYVYCKVVHGGEVAQEIAEEFTYVISSPFDSDGKVHHVLSIIHE
ncbi:hypothetical protein QN277_028906 [Acacia crassicarpa]|uniref:Uncharacterized protein n=1 Tax=Acacia crassicarpa TaxID=499986 RepID=A0AAE1J718_9FABA|nr:hypothetical protein QN277_028906 [Acacia crassicarpa]